MYVCICNAVKDSDIKAALDNGAKSMKCLKQCLGVSNQCGKCTRHANKLLSAQREQEEVILQMAV